jgi:L-fuconolactonase
MKIDSHQHFWKFDPVRDSWINDEMKVLKRDFLPSDLHPILNESGVSGCIAVQADQSEKETDFLLSLAYQNRFIKGVVGWLDLMSDTVQTRLEYYAQFQKFKGLRHIVQAEAKDDFIINSKFCQGIAQLKYFNFTYDILIFPKHLPYAVEFVKKFPDQKFVIDHMAKPDFKNREFDKWEDGMRKIAAFPNVHCKTSGLITEADWNHWKIDDFTYCLDVVVESFGIDRLMFGSDWPVCLLAGTYKDVCAIIEQYFDGFSENEKQKLWGANASHFYNL